MATVGVRELKNRLTQYLKRTRQGEEVVVTERGIPIALLRPIQAGEAPLSLEARLARLAAEGYLTLPTRKPAAKIRRVKVGGKPVSRIIIEDRR